MDNEGLENLKEIENLRERVAELDWFKWQKPIDGVMIIDEQQSELLMDDITTHYDGLPDELISALCQAVVDYKRKHDHDPA